MVISTIPLIALVVRKHSATEQNDTRRTILVTPGQIYKSNKTKKLEARGGNGWLEVRIGRNMESGFIIKTLHRYRLEMEGNTGEHALSSIWLGILIQVLFSDIQRCPHTYVSVCLRRWFLLQFRLQFHKLS